MDGLFQLKQNLEANGIFLSFSGPISQDLVVELGEILKKQMATADAKASTILHVFAALVEQSQNIIRHTAEVLPHRNADGESLMVGTLAVGYRDNKYFVLGGNKIRKEQESHLRTKLVQIQTMNQQELKTLYHQERKREIKDPHDGAGLGLIDLARKASEPIQFDFKPVDEVYTFFSIRTVI